MSVSAIDADSRIVVRSDERPDDALFRPRPKSHVGSPTMTSSPTLTGVPQFMFAVPAGELPVG
jgi:hypothetical protein